MNHKIYNVNDFVNESINFLLKEVIKVPQTIYILTSEWVSMHRVLASYYLAHFKHFLAGNCIITQREIRFVTLAISEMHQEKPSYKRNYLLTNYFRVGYKFSLVLYECNY